MEIGPVRRQSLIGFSSTIGLTFGGFFASIYIAHAAGPGPLGAYFLMVTYLSVLLLFSDLGCGGAALQLISEGISPKEHFTAYLAIRIVLLSLIIPVLLAVQPLFVDLVSSGLFWWEVVALVVATLGGVVATGVYGGGKGGVIQLGELVNGIVRIVCQVIAVWLGYYAAGLAGGFVLGLVAGLFLNLRFLDQNIVRFTWEHIRKIFSRAPWLFATAFAGTILVAADTIILGYYLDSPEVGMYRTAFSLATLPVFTMAAIRVALYPQIARWQVDGDWQSIGTAISKALAYSFLFAIPAIVGGWILSDKLLYYLYGSNFVPATPALLILLAVQPAVIISGLGMTCLLATNRRREVFMATATASSCAVLFALWLVPVAGMLGAGIATTIANLVCCTLTVKALPREVRIRLDRRSIRSIGIATLGMGILVAGLRIFFPVSNLFHLLAIVAAGTGLYTVLVLRTDPLVRDEMRSLSAAFGIPWPGWL